jgi:BirA family biotin operon repressor/biotin-[acetyl-CoA-carboxylase] ligase
VTDRRRWAGRTGSELAEAWGLRLVEAWASLGSTNDRAIELGRTDVPRPALVLADAQTRGRGRRGDRWQSEAGAGIWMSLLFPAHVARPQLPLVVGVACARAIDAVMGTERLVSVKWPNDLVIGDRKVGGILCESGPFGVVVGVGVNVVTPSGGFAPEFALSATALEVSGVKSLDRIDLARALVSRVIADVTSGIPFDLVQEELRHRDALRGRSIVTEAAGTGIARGIDDGGALLLERPDGSMGSVHSGTVRLTTSPSGS